MRFRLSNIGALPDLEMHIDGLTVITGLNGTGKSTLLKTIYCTLSPSHGFEASKVEDSVFELQNIIQNNLGLGAYGQDSDVRELLEQARSIPRERLKENEEQKLAYAEELLDGKRDVEFYSRRVEDAVVSEFGSITQAINLCRGGDAVVGIEDGPVGYRCEMVQDGVSWTGRTDGFPDVMYYDTPFVLDQTWVKPVNRDHRDMLSLLLHDNGRTSSIQKIVGRKNRERFDRLIGDVLDGTIHVDGRSFFTPDGIKVDVKNIAAGMKVFAILRLLADRGHLNSDTLLLMDEPEIHLHPAWINVLAKVIAVIVKDIGASVVMTTHSPQLLMAIEGAVEDFEVPVRYYDLEKETGGITFSGPLADLQPVYGRMAKPISDAGSRFLRM